MFGNTIENLTTVTLSQEVIKNAAIGVNDIHIRHVDFSKLSYK